MEDTRYANPFDAVATKGRQTRYLEAKGTQGDGDSVLVTAGEVNFARLHAGECVIGIVPDIRFRRTDVSTRPPAHYASWIGIRTAENWLQPGSTGAPPTEHNVEVRTVIGSG